MTVTSLTTQGHAMRVTCIRNSLALINEDAVRTRLQESIHREGPNRDLEVGQTYVVQAIEIWRDGGWWFYLHTVPTSDWPYPYPAEFFQIDDGTIPTNWHLYPQFVDGQFVVKRITFSDWANDDTFYEKLVDGDSEAISAYKQNLKS